MPAFTTVLVANRGEIARRVFRTAKALGFRTVAVFSDADRHAPFVAEADTAVRIGPGPARESYLVGAEILKATRDTGAEAIHPGYGFLSENAEFAQAVLDAGFAWIGPPPAAMRAMGNKSAAKARMLAAKVPCVPGYQGDDQSDERLLAEAAAIGFPLMVKAAAGGGGRGMRKVRTADELPSALVSARAEALSAFGDGTLLLEKLIEGGRHVEVQVFADTHGNAIHLGERDCSLQRRHQKIIEESPSPALDAARRQAMGEAAVRAALAVGYVGAGTIEFLVAPDGAFHFLEMNTRLQVEHPVTEMRTGLDLVEWQLRVALGEALPLRQEEIRFTGHAMEARLCAEDPAIGDLPQTGQVLAWRPAKGPGIRVDAGIESGVEIGAFYDSMVAKIITWGPTREDARRRLGAALRESVLFGITTNRDFLLRLLDDPVFMAGHATTDYIDHHLPPSARERPPLSAPTLALAATLLAGALEGMESAPQATGFDSRGAVAKPLLLRTPTGDRNVEVTIDARAIGAEEVGSGPAYIVSGTGFRHRVRMVSVHPLGNDNVVGALAAANGPLRVRYSVDSIVGNAVVLRDGAALHIARGAEMGVFARAESQAAATGSDTGFSVVAPISGRVARILVSEGEMVKTGQVVAVLEAMKMEFPLKAGRDARVARIACEVGQAVPNRRVLLELAA